ncbi:MAG: hypothetical protein HFH85_09975 [Lachnospiraceae bacterium]|jgi:hypothetical protein|nr:hypothetical protein [Lachnospiraceae bacterium]
MYIISKSEERKQRENEVLKTYHYSGNVSAEIREYAEGAAEGIHQALKMMERRER